MFLYAGYVYDPEIPWAGLLKSDIHIFVSLLLARSYHSSQIFGRVSSTSLRLQVPSIRSQKPHVPEMHIFTA
jgi:hypothetical protein